MKQYYIIYILTNILFSDTLYLLIIIFQRVVTEVRFAGHLRLQTTWVETNGFRLCQTVRRRLFHSKWVMDFILESIDLLRLQTKHKS